MRSDTVHSTDSLSAILVPQRKEVSPALWGVAARCDSDTFKTRDSRTKPLSKNWDHYLNKESASRLGSSLKAALKHLQSKNMISLGGGLPCSDYFPIESLRMTAPRAEALPRNEHDQNMDLIFNVSKKDIREGKSVYDLTVALNYGSGSGSPQLIRWVTEHTELIHNPQYADWACSLTVGNTSALDMALRMFTSSGDCILAEEYTFSTAVETAAPMGVTFKGLGMDEEGLLPETLRNTLETWNPAENNHARRPFLLYVVPTGQNPTGATQSLQRRKDIYRVAQEFDLIILEDDPYYFLQMDPPAPDHGPTPTSISPQQLLERVVPSYLALDTDGRVLRMDSFSKVVSPGLRTGWITGSHQLIEQYKNHAEVSTQGPSGLSQLTLFKLLDEEWGHNEYLNWLIHIRQEYSYRRDFMLQAFDKHLPRELVSWTPSEAGMFQWLKVNWHLHPDLGSKTLADIEEEIWLQSITQGVLIARGSWFQASPAAKPSDIFFRVTFAAASLESLGEAVERMANALRKSFKLGEVWVKRFYCQCICFNPAPKRNREEKEMQ